MKLCELTSSMIQNYEQLSTRGQCRVWLLRVQVDTHPPPPPSPKSSGFVLGRADNYEAREEGRLKDEEEDRSSVFVHEYPEQGDSPR